MTGVVDNALVCSDLPCYALNAVESVLYSEYDAVTHIFACAVYTRMLASVHILVPHCVIVHGANVMHLYVYILSVFMLNSHIRTCACGVEKTHCYGIE